MGAGMLKLMVARLLLSRPIGKMIAGLYRDRIPFDGMWIWTDEGSLHPSTKAALFWGLYEKSERRMIARYLPQNVPVIELGASIGGITNVIRRRVNDDAPVISVEANPRLLPLIKKSLAENGHGGQVDVIHAAISYGPRETVAFSIDPVSTNSKVAENERAKNVLHVPQLSLAQIVRNRELKRYSIVCDIEGAEHEIVDKDMKAFCGADTVIIELHDTSDGKKAEDLVQQITHTGRMSLVDRHGNVCVFRGNSTILDQSPATEIAE